VTSQAQQIPAHLSFHSGVAMATAADRAAELARWGGPAGAPPRPARAAGSPSTNPHESTLYIRCREAPVARSIMVHVSLKSVEPNDNKISVSVSVLFTTVLMY